MSARAIHPGWAGNWRALAPPDARAVVVPNGRVERRATAASVKALPPGSTVALAASGVGSRYRTRSFAKDAGLVLDREFLGIPTATHPAFVVEASDATIAYFFTHLAFVPPGVSTLAAPAGAVLGLVRRLRPWSALKALVPTRITYGTRR